MRNVTNLNTCWRFCHENVGLPAAFPDSWEAVDPPHTWNAVDGHDGNGSYDRGTYWYARKFSTPKQPLPGSRVFVEFLGAALMATVYVNGVKVAYHEGGFSTFRADITKACRDSVYPQNADFTFYGGRPADATRTVLCVPNAKLWSMDMPYLYTVTAQLQRRNETYAVWAELPFISVFNPDPEAHQNCISQMKELIIQNDSLNSFRKLHHRRMGR